MLRSWLGDGFLMWLGRCLGLAGSLLRGWLRLRGGSWEGVNVGWGWMSE